MQAAALNQEGTVNGPANPAAPGSVIALFGAGYGSLIPPCAIGVLPPGAAATHLCGVVQFNFQVRFDALFGPFLPTPISTPDRARISVASATSVSSDFAFVLLSASPWRIVFCA